MRYSDSHPSQSLLAGPAHGLGLNKDMYVCICLCLLVREGGTVGEKKRKDGEKGEMGSVDEKE